MRTLAALLITIAVAWSPMAFAHSEQRDTVPADGAQLEVSPPLICCAWTCPSCQRVTISLNGGGLPPMVMPCPVSSSSR